MWGHTETPPAATPTPDLTPSLGPTPVLTPSPEATLEQRVQGYLSGADPVAIPNRFYMSNTDKSSAPMSIVETNLGHNDPITTAICQGFLIGEVVVKDKVNVRHLLAAIGLRDGTKEDPANPGSGRIAFYVNLGRPDSDDRESLVTGIGVLVSSPAANMKTEVVAVSQLRERLQPLDGTTILFSLYVVTGPLVEGPDLPSDYRSRAEWRDQNEIAKETMEFLEQSQKVPWDRIPMSSLVKGLVNKVPESLDSKSVPSADYISAM